MKKILKHIAIFAIASLGLIACNKAEVIQPNETTQQVSQVSTRALGDKTPILSVYVETNDVNPLNAGDYYFEDGSTLFDIVELFAANIHKDSNGDPTLYLNDKLTNVLENGGAATYIAPLQQQDMLVLLTVLGDWQGIGVANMTDEQSTKFAAILAYAVNRYGLDGIGFDDEYANYSGSLVSNSYAQIIKKLHALMPSDKLITVFDWGNTSQIDAEASACIDYAYHGYFGSYYTSSGITGMTTAKWSPLSLNLGNNYTTSRVQTYAANAKNSGYGALMCFNLRTRSDNDPLNTFQAISNGAYEGKTVICVDGGGNRARTAGSVASGYTITYDMTR